MKDLSNDIVEAQKTERISRGYGHTITSKTPSLSTLKKIQSQLGAQDGVSLVRASGSRPQGARRQMAGTSLRNLMSQTTAMMSSSFVPGEYNKPKNLPEGSVAAHKLMEGITGLKMRPIRSCQQVNYDITTEYAFEGSAPDDLSRDQWARVSTKSQARGARSSKSMWRSEENSKCNGISVKWCDGSTGSGHVLPMTAIFSGLSKEEMPNEGFIVIEVEGMNINANLDARTEEIGYIVLMRKNEKMDLFFDWYDNTVVHPYYIPLLKKYTGLHIGDNGEGITEELAARVWCDSDMSHIARLTVLDILERNYQRGLYYLKIGAKTTGYYQPQDVGPFFKVIRCYSRHSTSVGITTPLKMNLVNGFNMLKASGQLVLSPRKLRACSSAANHYVASTSE